MGPSTDRVSLQGVVPLERLFESLGAGTPTQVSAEATSCLQLFMYRERNFAG